LPPSDETLKNRDGNPFGDADDPDPVFMDLEAAA
jgi:hypothetical protein